MLSTIKKVWDMLKLIPRGGPALCNVAVTNCCNASCDFCNFACNKHHVSKLCWIDAHKFESALEILYSRDVRYVCFFGGEPLLHPHLPEMISMVAARNMGPIVITNGWLLRDRLEKLAEAGLKTVYISIDSARLEEHEANRGLPGLGERIGTANAHMPSLGMMPLAQITMSKLIGDYQELIPALRDLGFAGVAFSYPQRSCLGSTSLVWSSESALVDFTDLELIEAFDAVDDLRSAFPVLNPRASVAEIRRHLRHESEHFPCYGGYKGFYMDWNYDIWRCDAWNRQMCSVWDFTDTPLVRDGCTECIACYRDLSVMLHFAVALGDALSQMAKGHVLSALKILADRRNAGSIAAVIENSGIRSRMAKVGN